MSRINPSLLHAVSDLERGLRTLGVPFGVVGALVPELLLDVRPIELTNDADVTVVVESLAAFEDLKDRLAEYGFTRTTLAHRLRHDEGGMVDILPFSEAMAPNGYLALEEGFILNTAGLAQVVANAIPTRIEEGPTLPVTPLPLYVLLKLVAFSDRARPKDLVSVLHCLQHYGKDEERRFSVEHDDEGVPFEYTCAFLLGLDSQPFLDQPLRQVVLTVLDRLNDADAPMVGIVARERARFAVEGDRNEIFELFRWFRLGIGL
jgi:predicted nucleotidyltransferase